MKVAAEEGVDERREEAEGLADLDRYGVAAARAARGAGAGDRGAHTIGARRRHRDRTAPGLGLGARLLGRVELDPGRVARIRGSVGGRLAGRVRDLDIREIETPKVDGDQDEQKEDRHNDRELDNALATCLIDTGSAALGRGSRGHAGWNERPSPAL